MKSIIVISFLVATSASAADLKIPHPLAPSKPIEGFTIGETVITHPDIVIYDNERLMRRYCYDLTRCDFKKTYRGGKR